MDCAGQSERCPTGIPGLDELLEGGFPRGRTILLSGACGTGKSIFSTQFLYKGVVEYDEPGIFLILEQDPRELRDDMRRFNFDLRKLEDEGKMIVIDASLSRIKVGNFIHLPPSQTKSFSLTADDLLNTERVVGIVMEAAERINARRVVIDSLPALDKIIKKTEYVRDTMLDINYMLKEKKLTSILVSDILSGGMAGYGVEEYVVDGVIELRYITSGPDTGRSLVIKKMRGTRHSEDIHPIEFVQDEGIRVLSAEAGI